MFFRHFGWLFPFLSGQLTPGKDKKYSTLMAMMMAAAAVVVVVVVHVHVNVSAYSVDCMGREYVPHHYDSSL